MSGNHDYSFLPNMYDPNANAANLPVKLEKQGKKPPPARGGPSGSGAETGNAGGGAAAAGGAGAPGPRTPANLFEPPLKNF
jgi:hypothetical protein